MSAVCVCVCCDPPRPIYPLDVEWAHQDDRTAADTIHLHVYRLSKDCDSTYARSWVQRPEYPGGEGHRPEEGLWCQCDRCRFSVDHHMNDEAWSAVQPPWWEDGEAEVTLTKVGGMPTYEGSWPTDEGYVNVEAVVCRNPRCANQDPTYRDATAEAAGY